MKPFSKILVPVDFSPHSEQALRVAADLARRYEAKVCVTHVHEPVLHAAPGGAFMLFSEQQLPALLGEYEKLLEKAAHEARAAGAPQVETKLLRGVPVSEVVRFAGEGGFDLIVLGTHGRTGIAHALIGSVAERVVRKAACPVLTVRALDTK